MIRSCTWKNHRQWNASVLSTLTKNKHSNNIWDYQIHQNKHIDVQERARYAIMYNKGEIRTRNSLCTFGPWASSSTNVKLILCSYKHYSVCRMFFICNFVFLCIVRLLHSSLVKKNLLFIARRPKGVIPCKEIDEQMNQKTQMNYKNSRKMILDNRKHNEELNKLQTS